MAHLKAAIVRWSGDLATVHQAGVGTVLVDVEDEYAITESP